MLGRLRRWSERVGLDLISDTSSLPAWPAGISGRQTSPDRLEHYARLLYGELSFYPDALVTRMGLRRIVLCADLTVDGLPRGGLSYKENGTLFLEASRGASVPIYQQKVIHHELFHMIDIIDGRRDGELVYADKEWTNLNSGGRKAYTGETEGLANDETAWHLFIESPGFITHYSTIDVAEDKAEVYANMITLPSWVQYLGTLDGVVEAKRKLMMRILEDVCECVDATFWIGVSTRRAAEGLIPPGDDAIEILRRRRAEEAGRQRLVESR